MSTELPWVQPARTSNVQGRKVADLVASRLRLMIARGDLKEGDWLPTEAELTEQFGVSRPTLREAFRLLEGDGLVHIRRGPPGGARVQLPGPAQTARLFGLILTLSGTTLMDVYQARLIIEPPAVAELATHSTPNDVARLRETIHLARAVIDDDEAFPASTVSFHLALVTLSGNHTLAAVIGMLSEITVRHIELGYRDTRGAREARLGNNQKAMRAYEKVVNLIEAHDAEGAQAFWHKHMTSVLKLLMEENGAEDSVIDVLE